MKTYLGEREFAKLVRKTVAEYTNKRMDKSERAPIDEGDVYIVWMCKILQNNKALASTSLLDGMYYELTYDGDKGEMYVDVYKKWENFPVVV